jgi:hypothetical protein
MQQPVDNQPVRRYRGGNRIDEEGHILVDHRQPHEAPPAGLGYRLDCNSAGSARARVGRFQHEAARFAQPHFAQPFLTR